MGAKSYIRSPRPHPTVACRPMLRRTPRPRKMWLNSRGLDSMLMPLVACLLGQVPTNAQVNQLTIEDKVKINIAAESQVYSYVSILNAISRNDAGSASAVEDLKQYVMAITTGDERIFTDSTALIEDNINTTFTADKPVSNLTVPVYFTDFLNQFQRDTTERPGQHTEPITMVRADYGEPHTTADGLVVTSLLYNVNWHGTQRISHAPYAPQQRVILFKAERKDAHDWAVRIAVDGWYAPGSEPFQSFEKELEAEQARSKDQKNTRLQAYRAAAAAALEQARFAREQRTAVYQDHINRGDQQLGTDPENALFWYGKAGEAAPAGRWDHVSGQNRARRALEDRARTLQDQALKVMAQSLARQLDAKKYRSVAVLEFTEQDGRPSATGKSLAEKLVIHLSQASIGFNVADQSLVDRALEQRRVVGSIDEKDQIAVGKAANAQAVITGKLIRMGADQVDLTTKIQDIKQRSVAGGGNGMMPILPQDGGSTSVQESKPIDTEPVADRTIKRGHTTLGATAGANLTRLSSTDSLTERFTHGGTGFRVGLEMERMGPKGNARFATGVRLSRYDASTGDEGLARTIQVNYLQLPLLFRLFTNHTSAGRFGLQIGVLGGYYFFGRTESYTLGRYIEVSPFNLHGSAGPCYELALGQGRTRIVAQATYDPMLFGLGNAENNTLTAPANAPRFSAISVAAGATFLISAPGRTF